MSKRELIDEIITLHHYDIVDAGGDFFEAMKYLRWFSKKELRRRFLSE